MLNRNIRSEEGMGFLTHLLKWRLRAEEADKKLKQLKCSQTKEFWKEAYMIALQGVEYQDSYSSGSSDCASHAGLFPDLANGRLNKNKD